MSLIKRFWFRLYFGKSRTITLYRTILSHDIVFLVHVSTFTLTFDFLTNFFFEWVKIIQQGVNVYWLYYLRHSDITKEIAKVYGKLLSNASRLAFICITFYFFKKNQISKWYLGRLKLRYIFDLLQEGEIKIIFHQLESHKKKLYSVQWCCNLDIISPLSMCKIDIIIFLASVCFLVFNGHVWIYYNLITNHIVFRKNNNGAIIALTMASKMEQGFHFAHDLISVEKSIHWSLIIGFFKWMPIYNGFKHLIMIF